MTRSNHGHDRAGVNLRRSSNADDHHESQSFGAGIPRVRAGLRACGAGLLRLRAAVVLAGLLVVAGCGDRITTADPDDFAPVMTLRAAVGSKDAILLETAAQRIDEKASSGRYSAGVRRRLDGIVTAARAGRWTEANRDCLAFQKEQL